MKYSIKMNTFYLISLLAIASLTLAATTNQILSKNASFVETVVDDEHLSTSDTLLTTTESSEYG